VLGQRNNPRGRRANAVPVFIVSSIAPGLLLHAFI
jgi:hypothetical protein